MKYVSFLFALMFLCLAIAFSQQPAASPSPAPASATAAAPASGTTAAASASPACPPGSAAVPCAVQVTINNNPAPTPSPTPTPRPPKGSTHMRLVKLKYDAAKCPCPDGKRTAAIAKTMDAIVPGAHVRAADPGILAIEWEDTVADEAIKGLEDLAQALFESTQPPEPDTPAPASPLIYSLTNHKARVIAGKLGESVTGISVKPIPNDEDNALVITWGKDTPAAAVKDLLKIIEDLDAPDTVGYASSHIIRLFNTRKASDIAKILNNFQSGAQKITVTNQGEDVLVLTGAAPGSEGVIDEIKRYVAVLDLPRPQLALNLWSVQVSSKNLHEVNDDSAKVRKIVSRYNTLLSDSYNRGWRVISYLRDHSDNWLNRSFADYVSKRFISCSPFYKTGNDSNSQLCFAEDTLGVAMQGPLTRRFLHACKKGEYCLGYTFALDPSNASLTNLLFAFATADRPGPLAEKVVACMESGDPHCGFEAGKMLIEQRGLYHSRFQNNNPANANLPECRFELEPERNCKSQNQESADREFSQAIEKAEAAFRLAQTADAEAKNARAKAAEAQAAASRDARAVQEATDAAEKAERAVKNKATKSAAEKAANATAAAQKAVANAAQSKAAADQASRDSQRLDGERSAAEQANVHAKNAVSEARVAKDAADRAADSAAKAAPDNFPQVAGVVQAENPAEECERRDLEDYQKDNPHAGEGDDPISNKLHFACLGDELQRVFASSRRTGLMRAAIADFLFHYKMSTEYPHDFVPYDVSHSADTLDSYFHPLLGAYNSDVAALLRFLQEWRRRASGFASEGIVTVSVISGNTAGVDAKTANSFESTTPFTIAEYLNQLKSAESNLPALLKNNLTTEEASAIVAAFNVQKPTTISIGRDLSLNATAFSLATGSAAELKVTMAAKDDGQPQQTFPGNNKNDINPSRVAAHTVDTTVRVESTRLFELSSLSAKLTYRGNSWPIPIVGELPWIGPALRWPGTVHRVFHRSFAIISAVVVPNAADLALGMPFTADRMLGIPDAKPCTESPARKCVTASSECNKKEKACPNPPERQPERGVEPLPFPRGSKLHAQTLALDSLSELAPQVREFHKEKLRCFASIDFEPTCWNLKLDDFPEDGPGGDKNTEEP